MTRQKAMKRTIYEWFIVVEGSGSFPADMLRYDSCFPFREEDSRKIEWAYTERRRVILCRRGVNEKGATGARWQSFGWKVIEVCPDSGRAIAFAGETV